MPAGPDRPGSGRRSEDSMVWGPPTGTHHTHACTRTHVHTEGLKTSTQVHHLQVTG